MKTRYTIKNLREDVEKYNGYLSSVKHPYSFKIGQDSGTTRLYHSLQQNKQTVLDTIKSGTPRDCMETMWSVYHYWISSDFDMKYAQKRAKDILNRIV